MQKPLCDNFLDIFFLIVFHISLSLFDLIAFCIYIIVICWQWGGVCLSTALYPTIFSLGSDLPHEHLICPRMLLLFDFFREEVGENVYKIKSTRLKNE